MTLILIGGSVFLIGAFAVVVILFMVPKDDVPELPPNYWDHK